MACRGEACLAPTKSVLRLILLKRMDRVLLDARAHSGAPLQNPCSVLICKTTLEPI